MPTNHEPNSDPQNPENWQDDESGPVDEADEGSEAAPKKLPWALVGFAAFLALGFVTNWLWPAEAVVDLQVGQCVADQALVDGGELKQVSTVDCSEPHDAEVFAAEDLAFGAGEAWPGEDAILAAAFETCMSHFEGYVGRMYEESALWFDALVPIEREWPKDRGVVCLLVPEVAGAKMVGSKHGSGE